MKIQVLLFAQAREIVGESQIESTVTDGTDVAGLLAQLNSRFPALSSLEKKIAVNSEYSETNQILHAGDEVAIIPPISGG